MASPVILQPEFIAPDVHRSSPFDYDVTATAPPVKILCGTVLRVRPIAAEMWIWRPAPQLPKWMPAMFKKTPDANGRASGRGRGAQDHFLGAAFW